MTSAAIKMYYTSPGLNERIVLRTRWSEERSDDGSQTPESLRSDSGQSFQVRHFPPLNIFLVRKQGLDLVGAISRGTHNVQMFKKGILFNDSAALLANSEVAGQDLQSITLEPSARRGKTLDRVPYPAHR